MVLRERGRVDREVPCKLWIRVFFNGGLQAGFEEERGRVQPEQAAAVQLEGWAVCLGGCSGGLGSAGTREEQEGSGHGLADWETREGRRSSSSCLVLWGVWGAGPGRLGSRIYGAGHPRPWGLELARGCQGLCLTELPLQNPHRRQTLQVPTSWLRKGFHSALQPPGECLPACLLPAWCKAARPLQRE